MQDWNPSSPEMIGLEADDSLGRGVYVINSPRKMRGVKWRALASEPLLGMGFGGTLTSKFLQRGNAPGSGNNPAQALIVETMPWFALPHGTIFSADFAANELIMDGGAFVDEAGGAVAVSDITTADDGKHIKANGGASFGVRFAAAGFPGAGQHVLAVEVHIRCTRPIAAALQFAAPDILETYTTRPGTEDFAYQVIRYGELFQTATAGVPNPPEWWTPARVQALDTTARVNLSVVGTATERTQTYFDHVFLRVYYMAERRSCVQTVHPTVNSGALVPDRSGTFSKVSGTDYVTIIRRPTSWSDIDLAGAILEFEYAQANPPFANFEHWAITADDNPNPLWQPTSGVRVDGMPVFGTATASGGPESQPYRGGSYGSTQTTNNYLQQHGYVVPDSNPREVIYVWVSPPEPADSNSDTEDLNVQVQMSGSPFTIHMSGTVLRKDIPYWAPTLVAPDGRVFRRVRVRMTANGGFVPVIGTEYWINLKPESTTGLYSWHVAALEGGGSNSWGPGSDDRLSGGNPVIFDALDALMVWATRPASPTNVTATLETQSIEGTASQHCDVETLQYVHIAWQAPAGYLSTDFLRWEVERWTAYDGWELVASIPTWLDLSIDDYEARIGVATTYRVSLVRTDETASDPATAAPVTVDGDAKVLYFTSNVLPSMNVAYTDVRGSNPEHIYQLPESEEVALRNVYGREYVTAFRPRERRGVAFTRTLLLNALQEITYPTTRVFGALTNIAHADLPYVCVRDGEGNRWLATIVVPEVSGRAGVVQKYLATIVVREVAGHPHVVAA